MRVTKARLGMLITSLILTAMLMSGQAPEQSPAQSKAKMMTKGKGDDERGHDGVYDV